MLGAIHRHGEAQVEVALGEAGLFNKVSSRFRCFCGQLAFGLFVLLVNTRRGAVILVQPVLFNILPSHQL